MESQEPYISKSTTSFVQEEQRAYETKEGWTDRMQTNTATQEKVCAIFCEKRKRDWTQVSCIGRQILYHWATWEARYIMLFIMIDNDGLLCPDYLENNSKSLPWKWGAALTKPWKCGSGFRIRQRRGGWRNGGGRILEQWVLGVLSRLSVEIGALRM